MLCQKEDTGIRMSSLRKQTVETYGALHGQVLSSKRPLNRDSSWAVSRNKLLAVLPS